jgi:hypothetical protein
MFVLHEEYSIGLEGGQYSDLFLVMSMVYNLSVEDFFPRWSAVTLLTNRSQPVKELHHVRDIIVEHSELLLEAWHEHFT